MGVGDEENYRCVYRPIVGVCITDYNCASTGLSYKRDEKLWYCSGKEHAGLPHLDF